MCRLNVRRLRRRGCGCAEWLCAVCLGRCRITVFGVSGIFLLGRLTIVGPGDGRNGMKIIYYLIIFVYRIGIVVDCRLSSLLLRRGNSRNVSLLFAFGLTSCRGNVAPYDNERKIGTERKED